MKQAILITAYKDIELLKTLVNSFNDNFNIYIHIDKKTSYLTHDINLIKAKFNVKVIDSIYKINWGGFNHLKAILYLAKKALLDNENHFFHLITGQDFLVKSPQELSDFFNEENQNIYLDNFSFPKKGWANNGGQDRLFYYNFYDYLNCKNYKHRNWNNKLIKLQKKLNFKRKYAIEYPKIYAGSTYWSMPRKALHYAIGYSIDNPSFLKRFKYTLCAEEFYFQTILLNSPLVNNIVNDSLRYIDWTPKYGSNPAYLDENDYDKIKNSNAFFMRKVDSKISKQLLKRFGYATS